MTEPAVSEATVGVSRKDSSLCLALRCPCGHSDHHHSYFTNFLICGGCGKTYRLELNPAVVEAALGPDDVVIPGDELQARAERAMPFAATGALLAGDTGVAWKDAEPAYRALVAEEELDA